jgi:predicted nuclease with TOPRIM domain
MKEIDTETKLKALELYVQGKSNREIANILGISHPTAGKIIAEINSGRASYVPDDIVLNLKGITEIERIRKKKGISYEQLQVIFGLGSELQKMEMNNADILRMSKIFREAGEEFGEVVEAAEWLVDEEKKSGLSVRELRREIESLEEREKSLETSIADKLREQGRIQNEIDHLGKERMALNREVNLAKFLREKVGNNEPNLRKLATVLSLLDMSSDKIYDLIETMGRMVKNGIDPSVLIERGEVLDFLGKFGLNASNLSAVRRKYAFYPSIDVLIEEVLKQGDRKEEMLKRAEYEALEFKKAIENSIENELKERREKIVELEKRIAYLEEKKSLLGNDVDFLEERVEDLKLERWTDIGKLELFSSLIDKKSFDTLGILFGRLVSTVENLKIPPLLLNSVRQEYPIELPSETSRSQGTRTGPFVGHLIPDQSG